MWNLQNIGESYTPMTLWKNIRTSASTECYDSQSVTMLWGNPFAAWRPSTQIFENTCHYFFHSINVNWTIRWPYNRKIFRNELMHWINSVSEILRVSQYESQSGITANDLILCRSTIFSSKVTPISQNKEERGTGSLLCFWHFFVICT